MRIQLLHLSGPYRGQTITYATESVLFGTASDADVSYPNGLKVKERHASLTFSEAGCAFHLRAIDGSVFVNHQESREVILEHGDLLEIGHGGPKVRFRIQADDDKPCKPIRLMLHDAREIGGESGPVAATKSLCRDLCTQASWKLKMGLPLFVVAVALGAAYLGGFTGSARTARERDILRERQAIVYQNEITRIDQQLQEFRHEQAGHVSREEVDELRVDLAKRTSVVDELVQRDAALKKVLEVYSRGVCLLHGRFTFKVRQNDTFVPLTGTDGNALELEYIGSGFLASVEGHVITNRHVAEPWWNNKVVAPLIQQGLVPAFVELTATFPGKEPIPVDVSTIRLSEDGVDVAVLHVGVNDAPVLPLFEGKPEAARGGRVVLLGYATGLNAILARAEPEVAAEVLSGATDTGALIAELARRQAISPVITQGALNEVRPRRLVYDAETTSGGSGGPLFGPDGTVIGVNSAITRDFDGSNFGVPIDFASRLLPSSISAGGKE